MGTIPLLLAPNLSERAFQREVLRYAKQRGWKAFHASRAQYKGGQWLTPYGGDGKGFPDLLLLRGTRLVIAELKAQAGTLRKEQRDWLHAFQQLPCAEVYLWRPSDWHTILQILE